MDASQQHTKVATSVFVRKDGKILMGKHIGRKRGPDWENPGGKLEYGENIEDGARREAREEANVELGPLTFLTYTEIVHELSHEHYITLHFVADLLSGEPKVTEPDKFETWDWFDWDALPTPLHPEVEIILEKGFNPITI